MIDDWHGVVEYFRATGWHKETHRNVIYRKLIPPFTRHENVPGAYWGCRHAGDKALWPCWQWTYGGIGVWRRWLVRWSLVLDWWHWVISTRYCSVIIYHGSSCCDNENGGHRFRCHCHYLTPSMPLFLLPKLASYWVHSVVPYLPLLGVGDRWNILGNMEFFIHFSAYILSFVLTCVLIYEPFQADKPEFIS